MEKIMSNTNIKNQMLNELETVMSKMLEVQNNYTKKLQNNLKLLYGKKVLLFKDKYHPKLPGSKGFEAHQDATIWEGMYKMKNYITMCIMLEDSTKDNGPLEFAKYDVKKKNLLSK